MLWRVVPLAVVGVADANHRGRQFSPKISKLWKPLRIHMGVAVNLATDRLPAYLISAASSRDRLERTCVRMRFRHAANRNFEKFSVCWRLSEAQPGTDEHRHSNQKCEFNPVEDRHIEPSTNWWGPGMLVRNGTNANSNAANHPAIVASMGRRFRATDRATGPIRLR